MKVSEERVTREERNRRQVMTVTVWKTDLVDIPYLREKVEFARKLEYFKLFEECKNFYRAVCLQGVVDWLYDGNKPEFEGVL